MIRLLFLHWHREALLQRRQIRQWVNASVFFLMVLVFLPLTLRPEPVFLRAVVPGIVWTALLFSMLLSAERLFQPDYEEGTLERWMGSGQSLSLWVFAKITVHCVSLLGSIILLCPLIVLIFSLTYSEGVVLVLSLISSAPAITGLCALSAAFSAGITQRGVLMALILLPLTLPILIFGSSALTAAMAGFDASGYLALLLAISLIVISFSPMAVAAVLRSNLSS